MFYWLTQCLKPTFLELLAYGLKVILSLDQFTDTIMGVESL